jgi:putative transposase
MWCSGRMRKPRLKAPPHFPVAYYHCLSRVVDRRFVLGEAEKEQFVLFMREYERFCGVRVVTYCIMSNHFHILLEVPDRPEEALSDWELVKRLKGLSGMNSASAVEQQLGWFRERGQEGAAEALRQRVLSRMWDVSAFMKLLKQRFTQWYNRRQGRQGTLWEERFKSVLVDGAGDVLATMAAYIDLNSVRAGIVEDPKDYRWCGYGEAMAGDKAACAGIRLAMRAASRREVNAQESLSGYRVWVYGQGESREGVTEAGEPLRKGFTREEVMRVVGEKGRLPLGEYLRLRVRYFADGAVLGTRNFVDGVFASLRERFGPQRKDGARRLRGVQAELFSLRALRVRPLG